MTKSGVWGLFVLASFFLLVQHSQVWAASRAVTAFL